MSNTKCINCTECHERATLSVVSTVTTLTVQERKQDLMRSAMWDAAIDLFAQKGFDETTVDEIAKTAGVSRRSFFRYFASKNDLMAHGMVSYGAAITHAVEGAPKTCTLPEIFRDVVLQVAQASAAQPRILEIMEIAAQYPAAREAQTARLAEVHEQVAQAFAKRTGANRKGQVTAHVLAGLTLAMLSVTFRAWFDHQQDIAVTVEQVMATLDALVCADHNPTQPAAPRRKGVRRK